jgi:cytochrome c oxidase assembly factor 4
MSSFASLTQRQKLLIIYKQILGEARRFPSIKRDSIVAEIRAEWRVQAGATDPAVVAHSVEVALRGLETLRKYTRFDRSKSSWSVELEQDPLGAGAAQARAARDGVDLAGGFVPHGTGASGVHKLE